jgi:truncated hemoglobin YjbI
MAGEAPAGLYAALGATEGCWALSRAFYAHVARDPVLRPLFPSLSECPVRALALYLAQLLDGPCAYSEQRWWLSLREAHERFPIGPRERDAWLADMRRALDDTATAEPVRGALLAFFEQSSTHLVNRGAPAPAGPGRGGPLARRWEEQLALDEAVAAVRSGDADRAAALAEGPVLRACFGRDRAALPSLLAVMLGSEHWALLGYAHRRIIDEPQLVHEPYVGGRTLLHAAAGAGSLVTVELLLRLGADPNATDAGAHGPLYCLANERRSGGGDVVHALVRAGANVHASGGVQRCTALHMAARRGNVDVARALLDCGAGVEARDRSGDTPLRRAVNLGRSEVAELLLRSGADAHAPGSRGLTPLQAARTPAMRLLLGGYHGG